jgi:hypothetical protein
MSLIDITLKHTKNEVDIFYNEIHRKLYSNFSDNILSEIITFRGMCFARESFSKTIQKHANLSEEPNFYCDYKAMALITLYDNQRKKYS